MYINICLNLCDPKGSHPDKYVKCVMLGSVVPCAKICRSFILLIICIYEVYFTAFYYVDLLVNILIVRICTVWST
jgi:hypothetical protein